MLLHLMRHGIAIDREDPDCPAEAERQLTPEGVLKTESVSRGMRRIDVEPEVILTSPFMRAVQTAEIVCDALGVPVKKLVRTDALKPGAKPAQLIEELSRMKVTEVLCCGHAPHLDEVIAFALGSHAPITSLKKAGVASLELESLNPPKGCLICLFTPRSLRKIAG
jgi:phosphohistidine phosphatase